jgi:hypothetical protein
VPDAPEVMAIQEAPEALDHEHPVAVRTVNDTAPPAAGAAYDAGATLTAQPDDCVTVTVTPPTVIVPLRVGPSLGSTEILTTPGPLPLSPPAIAIQPTRLCAVHVQPGPAITGTSPAPPEDPTVSAVTAVVMAHPAPCTISTRCPAIVTVPALDGPAIGSISMVTSPAPFALSPRTTLIHAASAVAVHAHCAPLDCT